MADVGPIKVPDSVTDEDAPAMYKKFREGGRRDQGRALRPGR